MFDSETFSKFLQNAINVTPNARLSFLFTSFGPMTSIFALNMPTYAVVFTFSRFPVEKNFDV